MFAFLKMQVLLRSLAKKSAAGAIIKRLDLTYTSSEDDITGFKQKTG